MNITEADREVNILSRTGAVLYTSDKTTIREGLIESVAKGAYLRGAWRRASPPTTRSGPSSLASRLTKTAQIALAGNSVCPQVAAALVAETATA